jgi:hypothetical protein
METKEIEGYPNYLVSNDGKIYSKNYYRKPGELHEILTRVRGKGYIGVTIYNHNKPKTFSVHRLVAQAFVPNPKGYNQVNHINSIRSDNRAINLEWCTQSQNILHGYKYGKCIPTKGEKCGSHILNEEQILLIRKIRLSQKISKGKLAAQFNVSIGAIDAIIKNKSWRYLL